MGLLDSLLGSAMGGMSGSAQGQSPLVQMALQLIQQNGGLPGIISKFQNGGMAAQAGSWVSTGENMPITGNQLQEVLGTSSNLAQVLPQIIDQLTPHGQVPANHGDMLAQALSALTKRTA